MKRASEYQLTKDNFDKDDNDLGGGDDGGDRLTSNQDIKNSLQMNNQLANPDQLKNRVVLKAKRRNISNDDQSVNVFSGFKGFGSFGKTSTASETKPNFQFCSLFSKSNSSETKTNDADNKQSSSNFNFNLSNSDSKTTFLTREQSNASEKTADDNVFHANLAKLNKEFLEHIKKYVTDDSSIYDLSSVCDEYVCKFRKLKEKSSTDGDGKSTQSNSNSLTSSTTETTTQLKPQSSTVFKFGDSSAIKMGANPITFSTQTNSTTFSTFDSNFSKPFAPPIMNSIPSINALTSQQHQDSNNGDDGDGGDGEDDAPVRKVESIEHTEKDSVYTKKDENFVEKGLGFLYIILKNDSSSTQLLIRADTNTGNILLNINLVKSLPLMKADNNKGVLLTCIPNPPIEIEKKRASDNADSDSSKKTVTFLIRVKPSDCDELFDKLTEHQK
ncbi:nuclear pore complex protein Nup50-like protein [Sarcoptes scabiei]|uniref:Nuclear pore complex protein Nup50-like protein n=1 Tax=Sarcoptes scabiei TaxID=52283 RepID=A0A132AB57_SARSC|nr:nuclear pore complex protein Nup50-like protein [Sarcoptes scabiei]